jgi:hypothetical protein
MEVVHRLPHALDGITEKTDSLIAVLTQQPANCARSMLMIDDELPGFPTDAASAVLGDQPRRVFDTGDSVSRGELLFALTGFAPIAEPILCPAVLTELQERFVCATTLTPPCCFQSWALRCVVTGTAFLLFTG